MRLQRWSYRRQMNNAPHTKQTSKIVLLYNVNPLFGFKKIQSPKPEISATSAGVFPSLSLARIRSLSFSINSFAVVSAPERLMRFDHFY